MGTKKGKGKKQSKAKIASQLEQLQETAQAIKVDLDNLSRIMVDQKKPVTLELNVPKIAKDLVDDLAKWNLQTGSHQ